MDAAPGPTAQTPAAPALEEGAIKLSLLAPALNEAGNVDGLVADVAGALTGTGWPFELIVIDDGSTDGTVARLEEWCAATPWLRVCRMVDSALGPGLGPSAVIGAGLAQARGALVATLDADRQNDPSEIPRMVEAMERAGADFVQGDRSANRRDNVIRRRSSEIGRAFRRTLLGDDIRDSACALRVMRRELALQIPFQFKGIHRFMAFYARMIGGKVIEVPVNHRPRVAGEAKFGVWNRALPGLIDLFAVRWMRSRYRPARCEPVAPPAASKEQASKEPAS